MPIMKRVRNFEHVEGREATTRHIANILLPFVETIVQENVNIYSSTDFKVHVNTNLSCVETLSSLSVSHYHCHARMLVEKRRRKKKRQRRNDHNRDGRPRRRERRRREKKREEKERKEERGENEERRKEKRREDREKEEKTKDKMKNKKIMIWTDAETFAGNKANS